MENYDKILYEMSFKEPPNLKSEEVYFNKTTSLELVLTNLVSDLRALYNDFFKVDYSMIKSNNTKYAAIIEGAIKKYERQFANAVNAEKVVIGLTTETNASAFPMVWDDRLISENIEKIGSERITFDKKFAYEPFIDYNINVKNKEELLSEKNSSSWSSYRNIITCLLLYWDYL